MQLSTATAGFGGVGFITDDHLAVPVLPGLVHKTSLKSVVAPGEHLELSGDVQSVIDRGSFHDR